MEKLINDLAQVEIINKVKDTLRKLFIDDSKSELHKQFKNPSERTHQTIKRSINTLLERTGVPSYCGLHLIPT